MIRKIEFVKYRKLKNISLEFGSGINAIAGTNGTCKSSLLYIASNSFQEVKSTDARLKSSSCVKALTNLNASVNPKIESLTKGDKKYNDPALGVGGKLFTVTYGSGQVASFRRHNSEIDSRYALKLYYKKGHKESLPSLPVVYLGISRLLPMGELADSINVEKIKKWLPEDYQSILKGLYQDFTHYHLSFEPPIHAEKLKKHLEFSTDIEGVDSNTISAGEDNLGIILTALVTLRYYYESLVLPENDVESLLLIDELDSTLHPHFQRKLFELMRQYSADYKIQIIFTTQSYSLLEYALKMKDNVIYLIDNVTSVSLLPNPDWSKVKMQLEGRLSGDVFHDTKIPVLLEDDEAFWMLNHLLQYYANMVNDFSWVKDHLYLFSTRAGCNVLKSLFSDASLNVKTIGWICVLDGDQRDPDEDFRQKCMLPLPGVSAPEEFLYSYALKLYDDDLFWVSDECISRGINKRYFDDHIRSRYSKITQEVSELHEQHKSHGVKREKMKKFFNDNTEFFEVVFYRWLRDPANESEVVAFYKELGVLYKKVCFAAGLPSDRWPEWPIKSDDEVEGTK